MKLILKVLGVVGMVILFSSCEKDDGNTKPKYSTQEKIIVKDESYGDDTKNKMDIFLPKNRSNKTKAVVFIHGGGWIEGDKADFDDLASFYADSGIAAFSINYRFADSTKKINYESLLADVDKALLYIKNNANALSYSPEGICLIGASAGAHLSLLYSYRNNPHKIVNKVVSLAGPTDFNDQMFLNIPTIPDLIFNFLGTKDKTVWKDASPITYNSNITTYLYHGKLDNLVPYQQAVKLYDKIKVLNNKNKLRLYDDCGHGFNEAAFVEIIVQTIPLIKYN